MKLTHTLLITSMILTLTACSTPQNPQQPENTTSSTTATQTASTPEHFAKTPVYVLDQQLLQGENTTTTFNTEGSQMLQTNDTSVLLANLAHQTTNAFIVQDYNEISSISAGFTPDDQHALIAVAGQKTGDGASNDQHTWTLYTVTEDGLTKLAENPLTSQYSTVFFTPTGIINVKNNENDQHYFSVTTDQKLKEIATSPQTFTGCGSGECDLTPVPIAQTATGVVSTFSENPLASTRKTCLPGQETDTKPRQGCLEGFKTDSWSSNDPKIAPDGANPNKASVVAINDTHLLGAWKSEDGEEYIFRTIDLKSPHGNEPSYTGQNTSAGYGENSPEKLKHSPNNQYVASITAIASTRGPQGFLFDGENNTKAVAIESTDNNGTGYGHVHSDDGSELPVTVHPDGTSQSLEPQTVIPTGIFEKDGKQYGVFHEEHDGMHSVFVAEYRQ
ncbi:hypothetical protein [Rothia terrae]|uniref:Uncharacterized protein n=1 Tax=Rothia terrae TaxID=396015 RepID=A0A7S6WWN2_9MICC|nr:hypothetical protein [Rothia terrae]QOW64697.1 hypothetical protein IDM49_11380 [Rothia terrae]